MLSIARGSLVAAIVLCAAASTAEAQVPQNIDYPIPSSGSGVTFALDYTRGLNSDAGKSNYVGIRFAPAWNKFGVWFGMGVFDSRSGNPTRMGAGIGLAAALLDNPLTPVTLLAEAGVGYTKIFGTKVLGIPIGITAIWADPSGTGFEPWIKPMLLIEGGGSDTETGFAAAAGFDYTGPSGFGFHLAVEWATIDGDQPFAAGVGLQYRLGLPGPM